MYSKKSLSPDRSLDRQEFTKVDQFSPEKNQENNNEIIWNQQRFEPNSDSYMDEINTEDEEEIFSVSEELLQGLTDDFTLAATVDSGATTHVFREEFRSTFKEVWYQPSIVRVGNGQYMEGTWRGSGGFLREVLFMKEVPRNLISTTKLVDDYDAKLILAKESYININNLIFELTRVDNLLILSELNMKRFLSNNDGNIFPIIENNRRNIKNKFSFLDALLKNKENQKSNQINDEISDSMNNETNNEISSEIINENNDETVNDSNNENMSESNDENNSDYYDNTNNDFFEEMAIDFDEDGEVEIYSNRTPETNESERYKLTLKLNSTDPIMYLHRKSGHLSISFLKRLVKNGNITVTDDVKEKLEKLNKINCIICGLSKLKVINAGKTDHSKNTRPFQLVGIDYVSKNDDDNGMFVFVDYFSNFIFTVPVRSKSMSSTALNNFVNFVRTRTDPETGESFNVTSFRTDSGSEFNNESFKNEIIKIGASITFSTPGQHFQNGMTERHIQSLFDMSRSLLYDASINVKLWKYAFMHSAFILNNSLRESKTVTAAEMVGFEKVDLSKIPLFFQSGTAKKSTTSNNLHEKSDPCAFITISTTRNKPIRYIVYLFNTKKPVLREQVKFGEEYDIMLRNEVNLTENETKYNEPTSIKQARESNESEEWENALKEETDNLKRHNTLTEVEGFINENIINSFIIFRRIIKNDGTLKYKARIVASGNLQIFNENEYVSSPTCPTEVNLFLDNIIIQFQLKVKILDITAAFLKGKNDRDEYVSLPPEVTLLMGFKRNVVKITGNLYGLKQAPLLWYKKLKSTLEELGFKTLKNCQTLLVKGDFLQDNWLLISVYVDDFKIIFKNESTYEEFIKNIKEIFQDTKNAETFEKFLGINYVIHDDFIELNQKEFINKNLTEHSVSTNHLPVLKFKKERVLEEEFDKVIKIAGVLRFVSDRTRPDILFHLNEIVSGWVESPLDQIKKVSGFVVNTADSGLIFKKDEEFKLVAYSDASHLRHNEGSSRIAFSMHCNDTSGSFYSTSTKTSENFTTISISSCEAEIKGLYEAAIALEFFINLSSEIGINFTSTPTLFTDNQSAIKTILKGGGSTALRHINVRVAYIHYLISSGKIKLEKVKSENNKSDILTKYLNKKEFEEASNILRGVC